MLNSLPVRVTGSMMSTNQTAVTDSGIVPSDYPKASEQKRFLLRTHNGRIEQAATIHATFREIDRVISTRGPFRHVEGTGRYKKNRVIIYAGHYGESAGNAEELKKVFRRLRDREAEELDWADAKINQCRAALEQAYDERKAVLKLAFAKANVIPYNEVRAVAQAALDAKKPDHRAAFEAQDEK